MDEATVLTLITSLKFFQFKELFLYIDQRYAKNFPDSVATQSKLVDGRQKIESIVSDKMKSAEMLSSAKLSGSATTQPYTNHMNSGASYQTSKYGSTQYRTELSSRRHRIYTSRLASYNNHTITAGGKNNKHRAALIFDRIANSKISRQDLQSCNFGIAIFPGLSCLSTKNIFRELSQVRKLSQSASAKALQLKNSVKRINRGQKLKSHRMEDYPS